MIAPVIEALYITNLAFFGGLLAWLGVSSLTRRRRGIYESYEGEGVLIIDRCTGEVMELRALRVDMTPRLTVCVHYGENLRNAAWTGRQDVYARVEVIDCGVASLGMAHTRVCYGGGLQPHWLNERGMVVIVLPAPQIDLSRLELTVTLFAKNSLSPDTKLGSASLGRLSDVAHGLPHEVVLSPQGTLTFSIETANVNTAIARPAPNLDLPVAIATPIPIA